MPEPDKTSPEKRSEKLPTRETAERALTEAKARRDAGADEGPERPAELGGPSGPDPVRYGDWERKGIASDF